MGDGNDSLIINGDGTHNLTLGNGDDYLDIIGSRNTAGNADNGATDGYTVIDAGDGNDTVSISAEHFLKADLGTGDDHSRCARKTCPPMTSSRVVPVTTP